MIEQEVTRLNLVDELNNCVFAIQEKRVIFIPDIERLLVKIELFAEEIHSHALKRSTTMLKLRISTYTTSSIPIDSDKIILSELQRVKYFLEHVVPNPKKKTCG